MSFVKKIYEKERINHIKRKKDTRIGEDDWWTEKENYSRLYENAGSTGKKLKNGQKSKKRFSADDDSINKSQKRGETKMKIFIGHVVSTKMAKTATVEIERTVSHPLYKKKMKRTRVFHIHDEESKAKPGDIVKFAASRPFSKLKKWSLISIEGETKILKVAKEDSMNRRPAVKKSKKKGKK